MTESRPLENKTVLVTGASRGIGRAIALGMSAGGANVIGVARTKSALDELGSEIESSGGRFQALPADLSDVMGIDHLVEAAWGWTDGIDALVNTAGLIKRTPTLDIEPEEWDEIFALNVRSTFFLSQSVARRMLDRDGGAIVNIASLAAQVVTGASVSYAASKAAVVQLTKVLAVRLAPKVRVNAVGPGYVRTSLNEEWLAVPENSRYVLDRTPLGRVGRPEDVVGAVIYLSSPSASFVTGQHLLVDGGWGTQ